MKISTTVNNKCYKLATPVSICITVKNEEGWMGRLLDSLINQTRKADEIVIVDGGSSDKTIEIVRHYQKKHKEIRLLVEKGGIAHGRNTAIEIAKCQVIASIDAGCIAGKDWLEKLVKPLEYEKVGVSAGFYSMTANFPLQRVMCVYVGVPPERFDPESFLPSTRSVAFKKGVWEKLGGFKEILTNGGDDTEFFYSCVKNGIRIARVGEAKVIWEEINNLTLKEFMGKLFNHARGDVKSKIWWHPSQQLMSHNIKVSLVFFRYILGTMFLIICLKNRITLIYPATLAILYLIYPILKWRDVIKNWRARVWLPVIQITSDIAVMSGFLSGLVK